MMSQETSVPSARGYGITKADLEASRLVFVSLRDSVPKRKVAVPVPDGYSWEQFLQQVKAKLRLEGVGSVYFASTGERIASLDGLEDIDELYVEEATADVADSNGHHQAFMRSAESLCSPRSGRHRGFVGEASTSEIQISHSPSTRLHRPSSGADPKMNHAVSIGNGETVEEENDEKYSKRSNLLKRMAQRIFPDVLSPGLPITTTKSIGSEEKGGKKRRRRKGPDTRMLLLICAVVGSFVTMVLLYFKTASR